MLGLRKMLASRASFGCVYECACGTIHIALGPVEVKFTRDSLLATFEMLGDALRQLQSRGSQVPSPRHVAINSGQPHSN